jgi:hypothetical protein
VLSYSEYFSAFLPDSTPAPTQYTRHPPLKKAKTKSERASKARHNARARIGDLAGIRGGGYNVVLWEIQDGRRKLNLSWSCFALEQTVAAHIGRQQLTSDRIFADTERFGRTTTPKEGP